MKTFRLHLMGMAQSESVPDVVRFRGRDAAGSFGILAYASRRVTALAFGLAQFQRAGGELEYLALPGGVLYFVDNELRIATTHFVRSRKLDEVSAALDRQLQKEEAELREIKQSMRRLDEEMLKRMYELKRAFRV
jgi:F-type H+-transporting ATPase subunit epsilon